MSNFKAPRSSAQDTPQNGTPAHLEKILAYAKHSWHLFPVHTPRFSGCACGLHTSVCPQLGTPGHAPLKVSCSCHRGTACKDMGKHPRTEHGMKNATCDADTLRAWWQRWPDANIGLATGAVSGVVVLDEDPRHGGHLTREELEARHGKLPETPEQLTGGGGRHVLLAHPGVEVRNDAGNRLGAGLDVRGDGGYIVLSPSIHMSGRRYEWEASSHPDDVPLAALPTWLLHLLQAPGTKSKAKAGADGEPIPEGQRNRTLTSLAGSMRRRGMTPEEIYAALAAVNAQRCRPPLPDEEIRKIADSVGRYEPRAEGSSGGQHDRNESSTGDDGEAKQTADGSTPPPQDEAPPSDDQKQRLPKLELTSFRPLREIIDDALKHWIRANDPPRTFVRAGKLVRVRPDEWGRQLIDVLQEAHVRGVLMRCVDFGVYIEKKNEEVEFHHKPPPLDVVRDILAQGQWRFPPLEGVTEIPVVRMDGSIFDTPGYDVATRLYYQPAPGLHIPPIPACPTDEDRKQAFVLLSEAIGEFPYVDVASVANAWAALLSPVVRHAIDGCAPMALIDKPQAGTGASLFTKVLTLIGTGRTAAMMSAPKDDDEWRKKITALLEEGSTVVVIDNLERPLSAPSLAAALTTTIWKDRMLGKNENLYLPQRATWLATGNNLRLRGDLPRRCYWIRMDAKTARPWERTGFTHEDLLSWVSDNRGQLLAALLTIVRGWYAVGCPQASVPMLGGFERWAKTVGSILAYLGVPGFLENRQDLYEQLDEEGPQWEGWLTVWDETWGSQPQTVAEIIQAFQQTSCAVRDALPEDLAAALPTKEGAWGGFARKLGRALASKVDVCYGPSGLHLKKAGQSHSAIKWQVETSTR
jgi:Bifunctional DNA primase/polymerase, N-terminal/Primase C terminal 1 (PriCT-1)